MHTQCPKCRTIFNVTEQILAVKAGLVRCGDCENVFNATWNLVDDADEYDSVRSSPESTAPTTRPVVRRVAPAVTPRPVVEDAGEESFDEDEDSDSGDRSSQPGEWQFPAASAFEDADSTPDNEYVHADDQTDSEPNAFGTVGYDHDHTREDEDDEQDEISDEEIRRTLRLDHDFDAIVSDRQQDDIDTDDPGGLHGARPVREDDARGGAGPKSGATTRIEPRLDSAPASASELSVSADDALLPRRPAPRASSVANRSSMPKRPAVQLRTPRGVSPERVEPPEEKPYRVDPNVHWVSIPDNSRRSARFLWASGVLLLVVLVIMQVRFFLVDELYAIPGTRPYVSLFCQFAGCAAPVRADPGAIHIVQTRVDLHPEIPGAVRINVNLINRAQFAQPYPALQLTLSDVDGRIVGRRTYEPNDYLRNRDDESLLDAGILAVASINLAHPNENAVGFETEVVAAASQ